MPPSIQEPTKRYVKARVKATNFQGQDWAVLKQAILREIVTAAFCRKSLPFRNIILQSDTRVDVPISRPEQQAAMKAVWENLYTDDGIQNHTTESYQGFIQKLKQAAKQCQPSGKVMAAARESFTAKELPEKFIVFAVQLPKASAPYICVITAEGLLVS